MRIKEEHAVNSTRELSAEIDQWIDESAVDLEIRSVAARSSIGIDAGWRPALFGAGALGVAFAQRLRKIGLEPLCFVDNDPRRWGATVDGLAVLSLAEVTARFGPNVSIVVTIHTGAAVEAQLREAGYSVITYLELALMFPRALLPWAALESPAH